MSPGRSPRPAAHARREAAAEATTADPRLTPEPARVTELGEVFTPAWLVRDIFGLLPDGELERTGATCLDPACGHGQFLLEVLQRKLAAVVHSPMAPDEYRDASIAVLATVYGVDIDARNVTDARERLSDLVFATHRKALGEEPPAQYRRAALFVLERNIVQANFLEDDFEVTEFRPEGDPGCFVLVTAPFSEQLPRDDPRRLVERRGLHASPRGERAARSAPGGSLVESRSALARPGLEERRVPAGIGTPVDGGTGRGHPRRGRPSGAHTPQHAVRSRDHGTHRPHLAAHPLPLPVRRHEVQRCAVRGRRRQHPLP